MKLPKLVLTDIDGVWTDGGMYYSESGDEMKKFNTSDSAGVLFLRLLGIPVGIITGENTQIVQNRAQKLRIDILHMGVKDKLNLVKQIAAEHRLDMKDIAYIGDDINDIKLLQQVGFSACPANAPQYVANYAQHQLDVKGGDGAFRAFVEHILTECNQLDRVLNLYLDK